MYWLLSMIIISICDCSLRTTVCDGVERGKRARPQAELGGTRDRAVDFSYLSQNSPNINSIRNIHR